MTKLKFALLLLLTIPASGCVSSQPTSSLPQGQVMPERYSMPMMEEKISKPAEGSIFGKRYKNIYADSRARSVGDIVMIKIVENSNGQKSVNTETSRDSSITGGISSLFGYEKWFTGPDGRHTPSLTSLQADIAKEFTGEGDTDRSSSLTATLSARVIDITMDGNLKIRGYREIRVNNETQHIILSGIVRPEDIASDNSILSSYIADARIEYNGVGALSAKQQPGWLASAIDVIWPF